MHGRWGPCISRHEEGLDLGFLGGDERVEEGAFREDLHARLEGFTLDLPAVAERRVDFGAMLAEILPDARLAVAPVCTMLAMLAYRNVRGLVRACVRACRRARRHRRD